MNPGRHIILLVVVMCLFGCRGTAVGNWLYGAPVADKPETVAEEIHTNKETANIWAERVLGAGMVLGGVLFVAGIGLAIAVKPSTGVMACIGGVAVFFASYTACRYLVIASIVIGVGAALLFALGVYALLFNRGMIHSLIRGFEAQKHDKWDLTVEHEVKRKQGKYQPIISKIRKKIL